jgi:hypothetical protein
MVVFYFITKLKRKTKRLDTDAPSLYENRMVLEKQSQKVCKPRVCRSSGVPWGIPKLMVLTILEYSLFGVPSFPVKKLHHRTFSHFFSVG